MRFKQFKPRTLTEADLKQLDELRMGPSNLQQFARSPEAEGIMAGFEAELVFRGLGGDSDYDQDFEPDYDADERCRSIQGVIEFFENDEYGYGLSSRAANRLQEQLDERYYEWYDEQMQEAFQEEADDLVREKIEDEFDKEDFIREWLLDQYGRDEMLAAFEAANEAPRFTSTAQQQEYIKQYPAYEAYMTAEAAADQDLDDQVERSISNHDEYYDEALDDFRDGFSLDDDTGFFSETGLNYMSDIAEEYRLDWPVMTGTGGGEGGFNEYSAERLADDLSEKLGIKTKVSSGYHSAKRDAVTWIFEPDSSLDADDSEDMPVEIVSPPMPLEECLRQMENFFSWAESNGAYANQSTGFHMGVSLPGKGGDVDYVKLALFLGDEHVLESFGRSSNTYTEAAMRKIKKRVKGSPEAVAGALDLMRHNLLELAQKALEISNAGFGKYTSINPQGATTGPDPSKRRGAKYIEFRSAGGVDESGNMYFEDMDKLKNTLLRYAQSMYVASRPDLERKEYYKKLYKLISPPEGDPAIDLFARYTSGAISSGELKKIWAEKTLSKEAPNEIAKGEWVVIDKSTGSPVQGQTYNGYTRDEVRARAKQTLSPASSDTDFDLNYSIEPQNTGRWEVYKKEIDGPDTPLEIVDAATRGEALDKVYDKYADQNIQLAMIGARPYYGDKQSGPAKELSPRAKLAKRLVTPKTQPGELKTWEVQFGPAKVTVDATSEEDAKSKAASANEHIYRAYNNELDRRHVIAKEVTKSGPDVGGLPEGFLTQRPSTGDYYEVRSGDDRVYGYVSGPVSSGSMSATDIAIAARRYVNNLTGRDDAYLQYRAGDPVQAVDATGEPIWQIYERESGHVIEEILGATQADAWAEAQEYLEGIGAEDPSLFSVRPKMSA